MKSYEHDFHKSLGLTSLSINTTFMMTATKAIEEERSPISYFTTSAGKLTALTLLHHGLLEPNGSNLRLVLN